MTPGRHTELENTFYSILFYSRTNPDLNRHVNCDLLFNTTNLDGQTALKNLSESSTFSVSKPNSIEKSIIFVAVHVLIQHELPRIIYSSDYPDLNRRVNYYLLCDIGIRKAISIKQIPFRKPIHLCSCSLHHFGTPQTHRLFCSVLFLSILSVTIMI